MNNQDIQTITHSLNLATTIIDSAKQLLSKPIDNNASEHANIIIDKQRLELNEAHERNQTLIRELNAMEKLKNEEVEYKKQVLAEANEQAKENALLKASIAQHIELDKTLNLQFHKVCDQRDQAHNQIKELEREIKRLNDLQNHYQRLSEARLLEIKQLRKCVANARNQLDLEVQLGETLKAEYGPMAVMPYCYDPNAIEGE